MGIPVTTDHRELAEVVRAFTGRRDVRAFARALLDNPRHSMTEVWSELADLGWLGIHLPEQYGGSGYGLPELVVIAEELGRAILPGPFLSTVVTSAVVADCAPVEVKDRLLPGLAQGTVCAALGFDADLVITDTLSGEAGVVVGLTAQEAASPRADLIALFSGADLILVDRVASGVTVEIPDNFDPTRLCGRVLLDKVSLAAVTVLPGAMGSTLAFARTIASAEAVGGAQDCLESALTYAKVREQFGRTIGTFQAVKHHLADMLIAVETAVAAVWDSSRAHADSEHEFQLMAACAATVALPAYVANAEMHLHLHGGIGYTWEHDAHLHLRRAVTLQGLLGGTAPPLDVFEHSRQGQSRQNSLDLPEHAERIRAEVRTEIANWAHLDPNKLRESMIQSGLMVPHWPAPWGRGADAVEQVVIEQEFAAAGVERPELSVTGWVVLTITQHGSPEQIDRFVLAALRGEQIWCQLFSEPGAGSDAAAVSTKGTRVDGGWRVTGQKVWTSLAHECHLGLATVRTEPSASKHAGITTMIIDMKAPGVEVRPLRQITGESEFNEVFLTDVFVPDRDVVGEREKGWAVARATLGNERVSIGGRSGEDERDIRLLMELVDRQQGSREAAQTEAGTCIAVGHALRLLNLRSAARSVAGAGPGPEGNVTKLLRTRYVQQQCALAARLLGSTIAYANGDAGAVNAMVLASPAYSIAGGTTEIAKNQIAERILGLPRDPLLR